jgi:hypothetical protein
MLHTAELADPRINHSDKGESIFIFEVHPQVCSELFGIPRNRGRQLGLSHGVVKKGGNGNAASSHAPPQFPFPI